MSFKGAWTDEEDRIIVSMQQVYGNQWAKVDNFFLDFFLLL
jgi:hypothetical protein